MDVLGFMECDPDAGDRLIRSCYADAVRYAARTIQRHSVATADAEDVVNSAFAKLWRTARDGKLRSLKSGEDFRKLLFTVVLRTVLVFREAELTAKRGCDHIRMSLAPGVDLGLDVQIAVQIGPDDLAIGNTEVERLLGELPDPMLRLICLMRLEGFTNQEICRMIKRPLSTVERNLQTIRGIWSNEKRASLRARGPS